MSAAEPKSSEVEVVGGRYEVEQVVGRGGMGAVYRVRDRRSGDRLALKRLAVRRQKNNEALALFEREFHTLSQLRHPGIIEVRDYGVDAQGSYYTMELLAGADLRELSPLAWSLACKYLRELASSLALLHARRLVHRDVTPQNVRVTERGHCKLIDFGALLDFGQSGSVIGTPPCVPPEAVDGKPIDQRLDLYALGCLGYYLLTGQHAYPATDSRQLRAFWARTPAAPSAIRPAHGRDGAALPAIPPALDTLVMSLIALDPMVRPSSAAAVIDSLDVITDGASGEDLGLAESYLASVPLCGRKPELQKLKQMLERTLRGRGAALAITAPAGFGRTRVLDEAALLAKLSGFLTLRADASEHPAAYGTASALLAELGWHAPELVAEHAPAHAAALWQLAPELARSLGVPRASQPADAGGSRAALAAAFNALIAGVARQRPIALFVDDLHRADEASLGVLGRLAHEARHLQLLLAFAVRSEDEAVNESSLRAITQCSTPLALSGLSERAVAEWLGAVLGDAPNVGRLSSFLHERTEGRPGGVAELLRFAIARGELKHRDGVWQIPNEPAQMAMPESSEGAGLVEFRALPAPARALCEALSMHRGALSLELCAAVMPALERADLATQLDALVKARILVATREGYRFASESLRERVLSGVDGAYRLGLHRQVAEAILRRAPLGALETLAAGVHLLEAGDARGLPLVTEASIEISERVEDVGSAARMLERALALGPALGMTDGQRLSVLATLGLGAYVADHRLARHTEDVADTLDRVAGFALARRLQRRLGALGAHVGLAIGFLRFVLRPKRERPRGFNDMIRLGVSAIVSLCGRAAICLDKPAIDALVARIAPLRALGLGHSGGFSYAYCAGMSMATEDRYARTHRYWLELDRRLKHPSVTRSVPPAHRDLWVGGVSYVLGIFEGFRGDARALTRAERLERSGTALHRMIAAQIRIQYHGFRGEAELVRRAHEQMESSAIEAGSAWQVETWSAIAINLFGALWHDVIITKRALRETQRMQVQVPSLERYAIASEATYMLRRGQPRDCVTLYESFLPEEPPLSRIGWSVSSGLLAEAHNQLGMHEEAKALCEAVLAKVDAEDRAYYAMHIVLEVPYAMALSALGEHDRAVEHLTELLRSYEVERSPAALGTVHEALARIALARGDRKAFTAHLKQVEAHFTKLANPALIARFQALTDVAGAGGGIVTKVAIMREVRAFESSLAGVADRDLGARHVLSWLMRTCEGYDGYLFVRSAELAEEPVLLAATSDKEPGSDVFAAVAEALSAIGTDADTTNFGTAAASKTRRDGSSTHLFLLSYLEADDFHAEGALVLLGNAPVAPPVRYELLQSAAQQLRRLNA
jgi:tetratricopeptide (TPR) repeat protein